MRIRKNSSRLLGSASDPLHSPPPPPPPPPAISAADQDCSNACSPSSCSSVCELNRSPWDLIDSKEEEHGRGIMGSSIEQEDKNEESLVAVADTASIAGTDAVLSISAKSEAKIKEKKEEKTKCCSKRGKGWSCTRPSEPSHNFCSYHLAKLRSSTVGRKSAGKRSAAAVGGSRSDTKKRALKKSPSAASSDSSSYYYYSRFVPWQAKRRGGADIKVKEDISMVDQASGLNSGSDSDGEDETENAEEGDERAEEIVALCNKKDGKGWECKKPAELPHSYCSHHLAKISSKNTDSSRKDVPIKEATVVTRSKNNKKRAARNKMAEAASESNFYYYYGGFGPWRSKVRGKPAEDHESKAKDGIEDEEIVRESSDFDDGDEGGEEKMRELKDIESDQE